MKKIYHCSACRYTYEAEPIAEFPERCPDCGKIAVRPADALEIESYIKVKAELANECLHQ